MEITPAGGIVEHSSSRQSESSEIDKMVGSAHVVQKSSSFEEEESSRMVSQSMEGYNPYIPVATGGASFMPTSDPTKDIQDIPSSTAVPPPTDSSQYPASKDEENIPQENNQETNSQNCSRKKLSMSDKQTSTSSLEEQQIETERESAAECLLRVLSREATTRPASLPSDLASLWQSLKIASELNKCLKTKDESDIEGSSSDIQNGVGKPIDLQKLFTPATDAPEILPKNKKMFASSSFYGPNHPTMEEQVELARRISSSLSDISNNESKGQSMYVNRKKRSVKWVHQAGEEHQSISEFSEHSHGENLPPTPKANDKSTLKLVMNPRGQVQDFNSLRGSAVDATPSPEVCFDLVKDLNSPCGKGAELFAKRRKKAEKWVVDESKVKTSQEMTSMSSYESSYSSQTSQSSQLVGKMATPTFPPNMTNLPTPTYLKDLPQRFGPTAVKNQIPDKYTQPKVRLVKSPWEAALEGSVQGAFQDGVPAVPSPTPRGQVLIAPSPSSFNKMATPPLSQPQTTPSDIYLSKPPKAWHPQPTGKQFSSVKLEHIFAGSPKSPVSLAYHADTNTISSEPVHLDTIPPIATQLYDHEVINQSILRDQTPRRPDQVLGDVEPNQEFSSSNQEQDLNGSVMWSATATQWSNTNQGVQWPAEQLQDANIGAPVQWPPQPALETSEPIESKLLTPMKATIQQGPKPFIPVITQVPQPVKWSPQATSGLSDSSYETSMQSALKQSLSEIQSAMTQTCQNFSNMESSETSKIETVESSCQEMIQSQEFRTTEQHEINKLESSQSEMTMQQQSLNSSTIQEIQLSSFNDKSININESSAINEILMEKSNEALNQSNQFLTNEAIAAQYESEQNLTSALIKNVEIQQMNEAPIKPLETIQEQVECTQISTNESEVFEQSSAQKECAITENIMTQEKYEPVVTEQITSDFIVPPQVEKIQETALASDFNAEITMNAINKSNESFKSFSEARSTEQMFNSDISSDISFKKQEFSSLSEQQHIAMQSQQIESEKLTQNKHFEESTSSTSLNKISEIYEGQSVKGVSSKAEVLQNLDARASFQESLSKYEKSEYRAIQESQYESNRTSMSVMSTTDEEVQDLCEREFNQYSMQYEKIDKPEIKKPAALLPGAVRILPPGCDFAPAPKSVSHPPKQPQTAGVVSRDSLKKPYKKPASMVPGAKPLFGEDIELHLEPALSGEGDIYSKIPVKNLIKTFEESTRQQGFMKSRTNIQNELDNTQISKFSSQQESFQESRFNSQSVQDSVQFSKFTSDQQSFQENKFNLQSTQDTTQFAKVTSEQQSFQESIFQQASVAEQNSHQTSLYATMPSDNIPIFQGNLTESDVRQLYITNPIDYNDETNGMIERDPQPINKQNGIQRHQRGLNNDKQINFDKKQIKKVYENNKKNNRDMNKLGRSKNTDSEQKPSHNIKKDWQPNENKPTERLTLTVMKWMENCSGDFKSQEPSVQTKDISGIQVPPVQSSPASTPSNIHVDLSNVNNFNTAARGWKSSMSFYRPVTFSTAPTNQYTDF